MSPTKERRASQCPGCGGKKARDARQCNRCRRARDEARTRELIERWNAGHSSWTIAMAMGMTETSVKARITRLRARGYPVPYRPRTTRAQIESSRETIRAARAARMAKLK